MAAKLEIEVTGEIGSLERKLAKAQADLAAFKAKAESNAAGVAIANQKAASSFAVLGSKSDSLLKSLKSPAGAFAGGVAASAALDQLRVSLNVASNLNEQVSKSRDVFGDASAGIEEFGRTSARALGLANDQFIETSSTIGALLRPIGIVGSEAAKLSQELVARGSDLASFYNRDVADALTALRAGIVGEAEPLRTFGVRLSEARVQQLALQQTGKDTVKSLTDQEKVLARISIIMDDSSVAAGNFAKTSDGLANQQRILAAQARDLQANLGTLLLPVMTEIVGVMNNATAGAIALGDAFSKIGDIDLGPLGEVRDVLGDIADAATRIGPIGLVRNTADIVGAIRGGGEEKRSPTVGLFSTFSNKTVAGLPGGPGAGGPTEVFIVPRGLDAAGGPGGGGPVLPPATTSELASQRLLAETTSTLADDLSASKALTERLYAELKAKRKGTKEYDTALRAYVSAQQDFSGVKDQIAADEKREADDIKRAARETRDRQKREAERRGDALKSSLEDAGNSLTSAIEGFGQVVKQLAEDTKKRAQDFKSAVLDRLDRQQSNADTSRALRDARENLRRAQAAGGPAGIRTALEQLGDATRARARFLVAGADFTPAANGAVNVNGLNITINGAKNPEAVADAVIKVLQRRGKQTAPQTSGRNPGGFYGIPR